jgi:hypothetical protein
MKDLMRDCLEEQILQDAVNGDTTVLAELLGMLKDDVIYNALSDINQTKFDEPTVYKDYAISVSDGHDEDWEYYDSEKEVYERFEYMKEYEDDIHLYKLVKNEEWEYEVIDSFWDGEL